MINRWILGLTVTNASSPLPLRDGDGDGDSGDRIYIYNFGRRCIHTHSVLVAVTADTNRNCP